MSARTATIPIDMRSVTIRAVIVSAVMYGGWRISSMTAGTEVVPAFTTARIVTGSVSTPTIASWSGGYV